MGAVAAILLALVVAGGLVYGAISQYRRSQLLLAERKAERERLGVEEQRRAEHARREAAARDDD